MRADKNWDLKSAKMFDALGVLKTLYIRWHRMSKKLNLLFINKYERSIDDRNVFIRRRACVVEE